MILLNIIKEIILLKIYKILFSLKKTENIYLELGKNGNVIKNIRKLNI